MALTERDILAAAWRATPDAMMAHLTRGALIPPQHLRLIGYLFYLVNEGYLRRLSLSLPPGHAKTTITQWACAWGLESKPKNRIIYASYSKSLAERSGRAVRGLLTEYQNELAVRLRTDSRAVDRWETTAGGGMWSGAVRSGLTGLRAELVVVDDPHKDWAEATSQFFTDGVWDWWRAVIRTRMVARSAAIVIQTRWSHHDLIGRLLQEQRQRWCHVRLPAIAETDETIESVLGQHIVDELVAKGLPLPSWHRDEGEPLWPTVYDVEEGCEKPNYDLSELELTRTDVGPIIWQGLYQQRPPAEGGKIFKAENWRYDEAAPAEGLEKIRWWDTAATDDKMTGKKAGDPDWTVGTLMAKSPAGVYYILDVVRFREEPLRVEQRMRLTAINDMTLWHCRRQGISQDPGAGGKMAASHLVRNVFAGFAVEVEIESGDKVQRAMPFAAQQAAGNVYLITGPGVKSNLVSKPDWINDLVIEASDFPDGRHDDMVDSASMAFAKLAGLGKTRAKIIA